MSRKKHIIIFGAEGVGKTVIINKVLSDQNSLKQCLYSQKSGTLKEALLNLISSDRNVHKNINEKNILSLRKMLYPVLDKKPEYAIFDHIECVAPKYCYFFEYLIERELPLIIIAKGIDRKDVGHLHYVLYNFEKIEISKFDKVTADILVDHYIHEFGIKSAQPDKFKKEIFQFSKGNPKIIKQLCLLARDEKYRKNDSLDVHLVDLDMRIDKVVSKIDKNFEKEEM